MLVKADSDPKARPYGTVRNHLATVEKVHISLVARDSAVTFDKSGTLLKNTKL